MVRVKICRITRLEDARFAAGAGAHYLGFVQDETDPAFVAPGQAREMIEWLHGPEPVGVFATDDVDDINRACRETGFTHAQIDAHIEPRHLGAIEVPTIKRFEVHHDASFEHLNAVMEDFRADADFFLLDTTRTSLWGGEGESFNWRVARALADVYPLFLGGDLTAVNLRDSVATMRPFAVDVGSSLESAPGNKDLDKLEAFLEAARQPAD